MIWKLFPTEWGRRAIEWRSEVSAGWDSGWIAYADFRTFVWTCAILQDGGKTLSASLPYARAEQPLHHYGHWIKLLNVDAPGDTPMSSHYSTAFEKDWATPRTYKRWESQGTLYGFNYHSGAVLGPNWDSPPIWQHFRGEYFDQILLLLYLRVVSFSFSRHLGQISAQARDDGFTGQAGREQWQAAFQELRWDFALFTNLYEFPLLSNHQQALEIYKIAREHMNVAELFREVQEEIHNSHEYLGMEVAQNQSAMSTRLTVVATIGLFWGLVTGALGMNVLIHKYVSLPSAESLPYSKHWELVGIVTVIFGLLICFGIAKARDVARFFDKLSASAYDLRSDRKRGPPHD